MRGADALPPSSLLTFQKRGLEGNPENSREGRASHHRTLEYIFISSQIDDSWENHYVDCILDSTPAWSILNRQKQTSEEQSFTLY